MPREKAYPPSGFGARLRKLRETASLSQRELAERVLVGVHPNTLARMERGEYEPAWPLVLALAAALGATPNDFCPEPAPRPRKRKE